MTESSNVNKSLENQIENMIDGIIGEDNEESSLHRRGGDSKRFFAYKIRKSS